MLTVGMSTRAVARECNVHFSTLSHLQCSFREFGSTYNRSPNHRPRVWSFVGEQFTDGNGVTRVPHCGSEVMVLVGISYEQRILLHFIYGNLNAQKYRDEILRPIVRPIFFEGICDQQMHICIPSHVKSID